MSRADNGPKRAPVTRRLAAIRAYQGSDMQMTYKEWLDHGLKCAQCYESGTAANGCEIGKAL